MLKISVDHNFLFVHVPRNAGSSIAGALAPFCIAERQRYPLKLLAKLRLVPNWTWLDYRMHLPLSAAQARIPRDVFDRMLKFAVVRNPWDRLVSRYHHRLQRRAGRRLRGKIRRLGTFTDYLRFEASRIGKERGTVQLEMLTTADGELGIDRVLRFESLTTDWTHLTEALGIDAELPHWNVSDHDDWRRYYGDVERRLVAEHWASDIEAFGYRFD